MSLLEIDTLTVEFPSRHGAVVAAKDVSITVGRGEIVGIVGESGAGKSTLGNAVIQLLEPPGRIASGQIRLAGERIDDKRYDAMQKIRGKRIGMIFQDPLTSLNPLYTIGFQLMQTIRKHLPMGEQAARQRSIELLEQVGISDAARRMEQYPHQFSGGMRQRVVIALALCAEPELVIADEPTTALDVAIQDQILRLIKTICRETGVGIMLVTHDMGVIAETTDRVVVMYRGEVVEVGPTAKVLGAPDHPYTKSLIAAVPRPDLRLHRFPRVDYIEDSAAPAPEAAAGDSWLTGKREDARIDGPLVEVDDIAMTFAIRRSIIPAWRQEFTAVDGVSFAVKPGEVFGLVGESGSGKSTVARIIAGLYRPTSGKVRFGGTDLTAIPEGRRMRPFRRQMQMIFQDPYSSLNPRLSVGDIIAEPIRHHGLASSKAEQRRIIDELLERVGLGAKAKVRYPHEFSGGQRQRISIARALATRPRLLICDEPTSALDVSIQAQILNILKDLQEQLGLTMLFISHDLPVIRQMCDRVAVMRHGKLCEVADTERLFTAPEHPYTRELLQLMPKVDLLAKDEIAAA
ncbi:ABC transporter ATP-binding protein [Marinivivus vitaminiproducens]|uniref:ABC transporter ATP-binding protein n=1 Tax=Marinivivus vitaminiproducens TaxID=3035935 RepID=UPI0027A92EAC|nr:ABC transporter ATP-binding protein [Geminicoccaceae bacterium SCSIO 64248]